MSDLEIWQQDGMPDKTVVLDFYAVCNLTAEQQWQAEWEAIPEEDLAESVPDWPDIAPYAQWRVTSGTQSWMIYQWWSGSGSNDDEYVYDPIEQGSEA